MNGFSKVLFYCHNEKDEGATPTFDSIRKKLESLRNMKDKSSNPVKRSGAKDGIPTILADLDTKVKKMEVKNQDFQLRALREKVMCIPFCEMEIHFDLMILFFRILCSSP